MGLAVVDKHYILWNMAILFSMVMEDEMLVVVSRDETTDFHDRSVTCEMRVLVQVRSRRHVHMQATQRVARVPEAACAEKRVQSADMCAARVVQWKSQASPEKKVSLSCVNGVDDWFED